MARSFNGSTQYLNGTNPLQSLPFGDGISFAVWFYPTSAVNGGIVALERTALGPTNTAYLLTRTTSVLNCTIRNLANTQTEAAETSTTFTQNTWQHAAGFISLAKRTVFLNGGGKGTNSVAITGMDPVPVLNVGRHIGFNQNFAGRIAHLAFWYGELTDQQVADLAAGRHPLTINKAALIDYYPLAGTDSPELSVLRYPLTLSLNNTPPQAADPSIDASPTVPAWSSPTQLVTGNLHMAAASLSGRLHAVGASSGVGSIIHRYSDDQGATWSSNNVIAASGSGDDLPIYNPLAAAGSQVYILSRLSGALGVRTSSDGGATFGSRVVLAGYSADVADRVQIVAEGTSVHVCCGRAGAIPDATFKVYYWRSTDSGATFGSVQVLDASVTEPPSPGGVAVASGVVHIGYAAIELALGSLGHQARHMRSTDNGANWPALPTDLSGTSSTDPQIRPRPVVLNGRVLVLWEEAIDHDQGAPYPNATQGQIRLARSTDDGVTWAQPQDVSERPRDYVHHPEVAVGPSSLVHATYRMSANQATLGANDFIGYRLSTDYGATWGLHEVAMYVSAGSLHPLTLAATTGYVHSTSENGYYARRAIVESGIVRRFLLARP